MILYFSGSGNTKFAAELLADCLNDQVVSLNEVLRSSQDHPRFTSERPFIVCFPIYAWNMPPVVRDVLNRSTFEGSRDIYFVSTMGANSGNTCKTCQAIAASHGLTYKGFCGVVMPDNYVSGFDVKTPEEALPIIEKGAARLTEIALAIGEGRELTRSDKTLLDGLKSGPVNSLFTKKGMSTSDYIVIDTCTLCEVCVRFCPLNNISVAEGAITFGPHCTACYGCIHRCPQAAINIKGKTEKRGRYVCPDYSTWKNEGAKGDKNTSDHPATA